MVGEGTWVTHLHGYPQAIPGAAISEATSPSRVHFHKPRDLKAAQGMWIGLFGNCGRQICSEEKKPCFGVLAGLSYGHRTPGVWSVGAALWNIFWTNRRNEKQIKERTEIIWEEQTQEKETITRASCTYTFGWSVHLCVLISTSPSFLGEGLCSTCAPVYWGASASSWRGTTGDSDPCAWVPTNCCDYRQVNEHEPQEHQARGANQEVTWEQRRDI